MQRKTSRLLISKLWIYDAKFPFSRRRKLKKKQKKNGTQPSHPQVNMKTVLQQPSKYAEMYVDFIPNLMLFAPLSAAVKTVFCQYFQKFLVCSRVVSRSKSTKQAVTCFAPKNDLQRLLQLATCQKVMCVSLVDELVAWEWILLIKPATKRNEVILRMHGYSTR